MFKAFVTINVQKKKRKDAKLHKNLTKIYQGDVQKGNEEYEGTD